MGGFVEGRFAKSNRKGAHGPRALRLHERHNQRRIDTAGQKGTERHVRDHLVGDRSTEQRVQVRHTMRVGVGERRGKTGQGGVAHAPVAGRLRPAEVRRRERGDRSRLKLHDVAQHRHRRGHVSMTQVGRECGGFDLAGDTGQRPQC